MNSSKSLKFSKFFPEKFLHQFRILYFKSIYKYFSAVFLPYVVPIAVIKRTFNFFLSPADR